MQLEMNIEMYFYYRTNGGSQKNIFIHLHITVCSKSGIRLRKQSEVFLCDRKSNFSFFLKRV